MDISNPLSKRVQDIKSSLTLEITAKAKELSKQGRDICSLSAGEPEVKTPEHIVRAASNALFEGFTKYGPVAGDPELRVEIAKKLSRQNNLDLQPENILITNGAKQAIFNILQALLNPGDEVIIPSPYWLSYPEMVKLAGGIPKPIHSEAVNGFKINIEKLKESINHKTKVIIINSPCNPTGNVITLEELETIIEIAKKNKNIYIISDEIYEYILTNETKHYSIGSLSNQIKERVLTVNGFAKSFAMTGWRIGYIAGNKQIINAAISLQSQSTSNVCTFAQRGALEALRTESEFISEMNNSYNLKRDILIKGISEINKLYLHPPKGAFYAFPQLTNTKITSIDFCKLALDKVGLVVIPGDAFGDDSCIRISFATSKDKIIEGIKRLKETFDYI
tara:strand:+ start:2823 stop:4001 length:1179 start_codon:yes stop_codon:yes gene_type:complete